MEKVRGSLRDIYDACPHKPLCDICDKRPATRKTVVVGIETQTCEQCAGDDPADYGEDTCPPDCWACEQERAK